MGLLIHTLPDLQGVTVGEVTAVDGTPTDEQDTGVTGIGQALYVWNWTINASVRIVFYGLTGSAPGGALPDALDWPIVHYTSLAVNIVHPPTYVFPLNRSRRFWRALSTGANTALISAVGPLPLG